MPAGRRRNGVKFTPGEMERALNSQDGLRSVTPELRRTMLADLTARKRALQGSVCSQPWMDACWHEGTSYPPAADTTPMLPCRCERCQRTMRRWPSTYGAPEEIGKQDARESAVECPPANAGDTAATVLSYECYLESLSDWETAQLPSSPSGIALRAVREGRIKIRRQRTHTGRRGARRAIVA